MGYDPKNPMVGRITDLGPRYYGDFLPPVIAANKGKCDLVEEIPTILRRTQKIHEFGMSVLLIHSLLPDGRHRQMLHQAPAI